MSENNKDEKPKKRGRPPKIPKPIEIPDDDSAFVDEMLEEIDDDKLIAFLKTLPMREMILSLVFAYAWKKAYGGKTMTKDDIILGLYYGFTIPPALEGGIVANGYAVAALSALGIGLVPGMETAESRQSIIDSLEAAGIGYLLGGPAGALLGWIAENTGDDGKLPSLNDIPILPIQVGPITKP